MGFPEEPLSLEGQLQLTFHAGDGRAVPDGGFAANDAVHFRTRQGTGTSFADGELAFVVVDAWGNQLSLDALDCRRFRVGGRAGRITEILAGFNTDGSPCQHRWGVDGDGALMPELAPYTDAALNADGVAELTVLVARTDEIVDGEFPAHAFRGTVLVRPSDDGGGGGGGGGGGTCCCGNGEVNGSEQCDDGNTTSGDGCSSTCQVEDAPAPACGDGTVDPGEQCDDGNTTPGDGCSATCQFEIIL